MSTITVESSAFAHNQPIPRKYTADGQNVSPPLKWTHSATGVQEIAMIVDDPDAPRAEPWVHWVIYKISPETSSLPEGVPPSERVSDPAGAIQGRNSWNRVGYGGPEPPRGHGVHHYHFKIYALDAKITLTPGATKESLLKAMQGHIVAQGELIGTYQR